MKNTPPSAPEAGAPHWRSRIVGTGAEDPKKIAAHPLNFRIHSDVQAATMKGALDTVGWWQHVTINRQTGRLLDGHLRVGLACRDGEPLVPVSYVELSEAEEATALASGDPIGAMADIDHARLDDLLRGIDVTDPALADLFDGMLDDSRQNVFADAGDDGDESAGAPGGGRKLGEKSAQIKPVLYVEEISIFERALRATGETNRGKAIIQVCQAYLEQTEGQLDI